MVKSHHWLPVGKHERTRYYTWSSDLQVVFQAPAPSICLGNSWILLTVMESLPLDQPKTENYREMWDSYMPCSVGNLYVQFCFFFDFLPQPCLTGGSAACWRDSSDTPLPVLPASSVASSLQMSIKNGILGLPLKAKSIAKQPLKAHGFAFQKLPGNLAMNICIYDRTHLGSFNISSCSIAVLAAYSIIFFTCIQFKFYHEFAILYERFHTLRFQLKHKKRLTSSLSSFARWSIGSRRNSSVSLRHSCTFSGDTKSRATLMHDCIIHHTHIMVREREGHFIVIQMYLPEHFLQF